MPRNTSFASVSKLVSLLTLNGPLLLRAVFSSKYVTACGLTYETNDVCGRGQRDLGDANLDTWIFRLELALGHLRVMRDQLRQGGL